MTNWFKKLDAQFHHQFYNPYPKKYHMSPDYKIQYKRWQKTEKLWPLVKKSTDPKWMKDILMTLNKDGYDDFMLSTQEIAYLPELLSKDEKIQRACAGTIDNRNYFIVLTDQNLWFIHYDVVLKTYADFKIPITSVRGAVFHHYVSKIDNVEIHTWCNTFNLRGAHNAEWLSVAINNSPAVAKRLQEA